MPPANAERWFLLRGSLLLIGLLSLWWFALRVPMTEALASLGSFASSMIFGSGAPAMKILPSGDWTFRVPLEAAIPARGDKPAQQIHSVEFDLPASDITTFTFSIPVFCAVMLAAPGMFKRIKALLFGLLAMEAVELLLLFLFIQVSARKVADKLVTGVGGANAPWLLRFGEYLSVTVLPYIAPIVVALLVDKQLRQMVLGFDTAKPIPTSQSRRKGAKKA
jgi:hypothetical protein